MFYPLIVALFTVQNRTPDCLNHYPFCNTKLIHLTTQGQKVQQMAIQISRQVEVEWAAQLGQRKMSQLRCLLEELSDALNDREDDSQFLKHIERIDV